MEVTFTNYAFISYSHQDRRYARWLQQKLEDYDVPSNIWQSVRKERKPLDSKHIRPIFRDSTDLNGGILADTLRENLQASKYLIVLCSPQSATSEWVSREVEEFVSWGRLDHIIPFIIEGTPYVDAQIAAGKNPQGQECMPKYLVELRQKHPELELLGIDVHDGGMEKGLVRLVSWLLGVGFDSLWQRYYRTKYSKRFGGTAGILAVFALLWCFFYPIQPYYTLIDQTAGFGLPLPDDAMVTIEGTSYNLSNRLDTTITLKARAGTYRGRSLPVIFTSTYFDTIRTEFKFGYGFETQGKLLLYRDDSFAIFGGHVIDPDGNPIANANVKIRQRTLRTDSLGAFHLILPIEEQATEQAVIIECEGYEDIFRPDECSSEELTYIMYPKAKD